MKKYLAAAGIASVVGVAGLTGVGIANAATSTTNSTNPMSGLVDAIASKFNLNKSDVQSVFDAQRTKMEEERDAAVKTELDQLVKDGKITQAQEDKIIAKRAEVKKDREANRAAAKAATREEMKTKMDAEKTALETWAKDNGIDTTYLKYVFGGGHGHGPGGPEAPASSSSSTN